MMNIVFSFLAKRYFSDMYICKTTKVLLLYNYYFQKEVDILCTPSMVSLVISQIIEYIKRASNCVYL